VAGDPEEPIRPTTITLDSQGPMPTVIGSWAAIVPTPWACGLRPCCTLLPAEAFCLNA
jgi:hypothetical protein